MRQKETDFIHYKFIRIIEIPGYQNYDETDNRKGIASNYITKYIQKKEQNKLLLHTYINIKKPVDIKKSSVHNSNPL